MTRRIDREVREALGDDPELLAVAKAVVETQDRPRLRFVPAAFVSGALAVAAVVGVGSSASTRALQAERTDAVIAPSGRVTRDRDAGAGQRRGRFWLETALGSLSAVLAVATIIHKDWIEPAFGLDPDHGNGSLEWALVVILLVAAIALGLAARREWRRPLRVSSAASG